MKVTDWHRKLSLAAKTFAVAGTGRGMLARIRHFAAIAKTEDFTREIIQTRCERGSAIPSALSRRGQLQHDRVATGKICNRPSRPKAHGVAQGRRLVPMA